jgi:hypothetical protein
MSFNIKVKLTPGVCNRDCLIDWLVTVVCVITPFLFDTGYRPFYEIFYMQTMSSVIDQLTHLLSTVNICYIYQL